MATIKPIEGRTIHQIQSGQVIVDLCSVVKELVENSLDAGATSIDVRFKNQGLDSIEVQDNGSGISPQNYETIALKHHTSKLSTYSDLTTLQTFGFRGEALSSLCALSHFTVTTCLAADAPKATRLEFETSGKLKGTSVVAAQKGSTVTVENLFNNLPVRRRELERNIKREWNRVVSLLGQYACIQTSVKTSVTQQPLKGKRTTLFSTKGNQSTRENIVNVFGAKTLIALLRLDLKLELEPSSGPSQRWNKQEHGETKEIRIVGHISRPAYGEGRQTPDRQMFFVNARPCGLPQVAKAFNEVYKSYNNSQSPFIFANIEMDTHLYDVNVSPDKRTILLHDQTRMLEHLKIALTQLFESQDHTVPISQLPAQKQPSYRQLVISKPDVVSKEVSRASAEPTRSDETSDDERLSASEDRGTDEEDLPVEARPRVRPAALSRDSLNREHEAVSLISNWLGRKSDDRIGQESANSKKSVDKLDALSKEKRKLVEKLGKENNQVNTAVDMSPNGGESNDESVPVEEISTPLIGGIRSISQGEIIIEDVNQVDIEASKSEESIPAIISPTRRPVPTILGPSQGVAKPFRPLATMATITIGNHMVTSQIGTPSPKRIRLEKPNDDAAGQSPLPSFGSRLSQRFAAPSTSVTQSTEAGGLGELKIAEVERSSLSTDDQVSLPTMGQFEISRDDETTPQRTVGARVFMEDSSLTAPSEDIDGDYMDEEEKRVLEEAKVQEMIKAAEEEAARPSDENAKRAGLLLKGGGKRKDATIELVQSLDIRLATIAAQLGSLKEVLSKYDIANGSENVTDVVMDSDTAEERLSLTINKSDFANMKIIGQFNLGFILASRTGSMNGAGLEAPLHTDNLFIIDQHASDEKYNFERFQTTTIVQSQRLVRPKTLDLTAVEEEIVMENLAALETNGFIVTVDTSGTAPVGQRCQLISLPISRETTFSLSDLEELISLLSEHPSGSVPRPSKVRKMFAMRACRSSIMIGRTLTPKQMSKVVKHMGEIDKPWNCPHGRPTMRHLYDLGVWDEVGWKEGDGIDDERQGYTDWAGYVRQNRASKESFHYDGLRRR